MEGKRNKTKRQHEKIIRIRHREKEERVGNKALIMCWSEPELEEKQKGEQEDEGRTEEQDRRRKKEQKHRKKVKSESK